MLILDYIESVELTAKSEAERAKMLCYYHVKETEETSFTMSTISELMEHCGFSKPNSSRLRDNLTKGSKNASGYLRVKKIS